MNNIIYKLWFAEIPIKYEYELTILQSSIEPEEFYKWGLSDYINSGFDMITAEVIMKSKDLKRYITTLKYVKDTETNILFYNDDNYPERLKNIYNPPILLFIKGDISEYYRTIAVVGARKATDYGKTAAYKLAFELAKYGIVVVSGMARGIDTCAHNGSLDAGGKTFAVLGSGFDNIYPGENKNLFSRITKQGCVITEFFQDVKPLSYNFPRRNRIISGLAEAILVIEAGERSGSLITASLALEQGKDVFAVPGNIFSSASVGTNKLIRDGAKIISSVEDILEEYNINMDNKGIVMDLLLDEEKRIVNYIKNSPMTIEKLQEMSGINPEVLLSLLCKLECKGFVKKVYGGYYIIS